MVLDEKRARREGWLDQVTDSKQLTAKKRDGLFDHIQRGARGCAIAQSEAQEIDEINILQATLRAMKRAVDELLETLDLDNPLVAVDGNTRIPEIVTQEAVIKGDSRSYAIAAASILAKVARDRIMILLDDEPPPSACAGCMIYSVPPDRVIAAPEVPRYDSMTSGWARTSAGGPVTMT